MYQDLDLDVARLGPLACVASLGTLTRGNGNGTGPARLMDCGADITLRQDGGHVVMRALL